MTAVSCWSCSQAPAEKNLHLVRVATISWTCCIARQSTGSLQLTFTPLGTPSCAGYQMSCSGYALQSRQTRHRYEQCNSVFASYMTSMLRTTKALVAMNPQLFYAQTYEIRLSQSKRERELLHSKLWSPLEGVEFTARRIETTPAKDECKLSFRGWPICAARGCNGKFDRSQVYVLFGSSCTDTFDP